MFELVKGLKIIKNPEKMGNYKARTQITLQVMRTSVFNAHTRCTLAPTNQNPSPARLTLPRQPSWPRGKPPPPPPPPPQHRLLPVVSSPIGEEPRLHHRNDLPPNLHRGR